MVIANRQKKIEIQLSKGEGWDPVIKWGGLGSSHQKERVGIQLSNGEGWDPIIKRGELGTIPPTSTKQTFTSHLDSLHIKKDSI
jgi:hypothetical protein